MPPTPDELEQIERILIDAPGVTHVEAVPTILVNVAVAPGSCLSDLLEKELKLRLSNRHLILDFRIWKQPADPT